MSEIVERRYGILEEGDVLTPGVYIVLNEFRVRLLEKEVVAYLLTLS